MGNLPDTSGRRRTRHARNLLTAWAVRHWLLFMLSTSLTLRTVFAHTVIWRPLLRTADRIEWLDRRPPAVPCRLA